MCVDLNNILVNNKKDKSSYQTFYKVSKDPDYVNNLRQFGGVEFVLKEETRSRARSVTMGRKQLWYDM